MSPSRRSVLAGIGTGMIGVGGLAVVSESDAFSSVSASRGSTVDVSADNAGALLGITGRTDSSTIPTFENNTSHEMFITLTSTEEVEFDVGDDGGWSETGEFQLASGSAESVNIRYLNQCSGGDMAPVDVFSELGYSQNPQVGSIDMSRDFAVSQATAVNLVGNLNSPGQSGKYSFTLQNSSNCVDVEIEAVKLIKSSKPTADRVSPQGNQATFEAGGTKYSSQTLYLQENYPNEDPVYLDQNLVLNSNEEVDILLKTFRNQSGGKISMGGEDLQIRLYPVQENSAIVDICSGQCNY